MRAGWFISWWMSLWLMYLLLVGTLELAEVAAGCVVAFLGTCAVRLVRKHGGLHFVMRTKWLRPLATLPGKALRDCAVVLAADCRWPFRKRGRGRFQELDFNCGGNHAVSVTRRALVTAAISFPPNSFVVWLDRKPCKLLVHQLIPSPQTSRDKDWPI